MHARKRIPMQRKHKYNICSIFKQDYVSVTDRIGLNLLCFFTFLFLAAFDAAVDTEVEVKFAWYFLWISILLYVNKLYASALKPQLTMASLQWHLWYRFSMQHYTKERRNIYSVGKFWGTPEILGIIWKNCLNTDTKHSDLGQRFFSPDEQIRLEKLYGKKTHDHFLDARCN